MLLYVCKQRKFECAIVLLQRVFAAVRKMALTPSLASCSNHAIMAWPLASRPYTLPVFTARGHGPLITRVSFWTPVSTAVLTRAIAGVLQIENNYDVINNSACRYRWPVFTGLKNDARVHGPWTWPLNTPFFSKNTMIQPFQDSGRIATEWPGRTYSPTFARAGGGFLQKSEWVCEGG